MRAGFGYESTSITAPGALGIVGLTPGTRILGTPAVTGSVGTVYKQPLFGATSGFISVDYSYTGDSISLLNGGGVPPMPPARRYNARGETRRRRNSDRSG